MGICAVVFNSFIFSNLVSSLFESELLNKYQNSLKISLTILKILQVVKHNKNFLPRAVIC